MSEVSFQSLSHEQLRALKAEIESVLKLEPAREDAKNALAQVNALLEQPVMLFYHADNCNRFIKAGGLQFSFEPYQHLGGSWHGIYKTENPKEQAALATLVANKKTAVTQISAEDFDKCLKKKLRLQQTSGISVPQQPASATSAPLVQDAPVAGQLVSSELPPPPPKSDLLATASAALNLGPVKTPTTPAPTTGENGGSAPTPEGATTGCDLS